MVHHVIDDHQWLTKITQICSQKYDCSTWKPELSYETLVLSTSQFPSFLPQKVTACLYLLLWDMFLSSLIFTSSAHREDRETFILNWCAFLLGNSRILTPIHSAFTHALVEIMFQLLPKDTLTSRCILQSLLQLSNLPCFWLEALYEWQWERKPRNNAIVEYLDYQIPVTQLNGPRGVPRLSDTRYSAKETKGVEYINYQIPVTQLKGPKGNGRYKQ